MTADLESQKFKSRDAASYDSVTEQFDDFTQRLTHPLAKLLVEFAEIAPHEKILDIGTGTGVVSLEASQLISNPGKIYGIDLSPEMLATAEKKAGEQNVRQKIIFRAMDAESLDFDDRMFDAAVSLFALLHFPNPLTALREIFRVLRPGGRLVLAIGSGAPVFSPSGWFHILKRMPDVLRNMQGKMLFAPQFLDNFVNKHIPQKAEPEESHIAAKILSRNHNVKNLVKEAGFEILKTDWKGHQAIIETPEEFWEIQRTFSSIARKRLSTVSSDRFEVLHHMFLEECRAVKSRGGSLVYPFGAFFVIARRSDR